MATQARGWVAAHRDAKPELHFHYPPNVRLMVTVSRAITLGFISFNEDGRALVEATCAGFTDEREATVNMLRVATEHFDTARPMAPSRCPSCGVPSEVFDGVGVQGEQWDALDFVPAPGVDPILCAHCGAVNMADERQQLRSTTPEELAALLSDPTYRAMIETLRKGIAARKEKGNP